MTPRRRQPPKRERAARLPAALLALALVMALLGLAGVYRLVLAPEAGRPIGGAFSLTDARGRPQTDRNLRGRFALLFFGYTRCADICPTTLAVMSTVLDRVDPAAKRIQPVFVSVDPVRDTPARLRAYVEHFSPTLLGLTGTPAQLDRIERAFHVTVHPLREDGADVVEHSAALYLLGPDGTLRVAIPADIEGADLEALLRRTLPAGGGAI